MSCPINTLLSQGAAFASLSEREKEMAITWLLNDAMSGAGAQRGAYQALGEREQWLCIATLLDEVANSIAHPGAVTDSNPTTLLAGNPGFQGASEGDGNSAIAQQACNA